MKVLRVDRGVERAAIDVSYEPSDSELVHVLLLDRPEEPEEEEIEDEM